MATEEKSAAAAARSLVRAAEKATLATLIGADRAPYASMVMTGCDQSARPLLLISKLAQHTQNVDADPRVAIAFDGTAGYENPLTGPRVSVTGILEPCAEPAALARYTRRFPDARAYLALGDFHLYRLAVARAHIVAGFGAIDWLTAEEAMFPAAPALEAAEEDILAHMNADHADALGFYAASHGAFGGAGEGARGGGWTMTGIDPEGFDMRGPGGLLRVAFDTPIDGPEAARLALAQLARAARRGAG